MAKHYVSNKDESVRMFKSNFLEAFSKVHPITPLIVFLPVIAYFWYLAAGYEMPWYRVVGWSVLGLIAWTLVEYVMHRFIFHFMPSSEWGKRLHFIFHGVHHDYPNDSRRLVLPPSVSIPLASMFYFLFRAMLNEQALPAFFATFLTGYLIYDLGHYALHHFPLRYKFWQTLKLHHMKHHYQEPDHGYGVSSPLWDWILRTDFKPTKPKEHQKA
jgi:sterol desaturase/sphingolipid hydroxylase (fatty acid hydroxylase superfamily)